MTQPELFQAMAIRSAMGLYLRTGIKANRLYTPANMTRTASRICGRPFRNLREAFAGMNELLADKAGRRAHDITE